MKHFIALTLLSALGQEPAKEKPPAAAQETPKRFVRSFLDARDRNLKSELELLVAEHGILPAASDKALPADQALKRLRELVDKMSDAKARDGLAKAPHAKTADGLQAMAAAAALSDNKIGALAALLTAVEKFPANVDARANLAGMAATLGLAAEALAVLDKIDEKAVSTSGMGVPGRSIVLAIRGHALVSQHRYAEAKDVLKQALTAAPQLSEAGLNLAIALQKLGEKDEAKRVFFAAAWRSPPSRLVCGGGNDQFTGDPFKDSFGDDVTSRLPASKILDLSKGVAGTFPKIPFSSNLEELETFAKWAELEGKKVAERVLADQKEYLALAEKVGARKQTLSERRARDIHSLIGVAEQEPELKKIWLPWENRDDLRKNLNSLVEAGQKEWLDLAQSKLEEAVLKQKLIALSNRLIAAAHPIAKQYDRLARDWWAAAHKHKTGLAANLKDKDWHDMAMAGIRLEGDAFYGMLIVEIGRCYASCAYTTATPKKPAESEDLQKASVPACSGDAKNTELELKFTHLLSISVSCEKVGVELGVDVFPGLGGFAKLEIERDGVSIHMGPKGEIPVAGTGGVGTMTVKDGLYIEMGSEGIRDVGLEVGFEAGAGAQGVKVSRSLAETMKFSFLPTPAR